MRAASGGLRVLHVAEAVRGGVATYLRTLVDEQRRDPGIHSVQVLVPARHADELGAIGSHLATITPGDGRLSTALALARRARQRCTDGGVDIVHLHSTFAGAAARLLRPPAGALIYCPHGWAFDREGSPLMRNAVRVAEALLAPRCDAIVAISEHEYAAGRALGIPEAKLHLVRNGIAPEQSQRDWSDPWPAHTGLRLLFVGRFDRQKAFDVYVTVARALPETHCVAIGDYSVDAPRGALALPPNLHTPGWQSHEAVQRWMKHADVLVMPSRWEGFGLTAVEAMRAGLPVIASRVGGLQEIVSDGETGWLVPPANADSIIECVRGAKLPTLRALGAAGQRRYAARFTAARMHADLLALYRHCLDGRPARHASAPGEQADAGQDVSLRVSRR